MLRPFTIILWLIILSGVVIAIAVHFFLGMTSGSVSLADMPVLAPPGQPSRWMAMIREITAAINVQLILYGALALIGFLLILRALISTVIVLRHRNLVPLPRPGVVQQASPVVTKRWGILGSGLGGKMLLAFTGTAALFGFCALVIVYFSLTNAFREHQLQRAIVLAVNVSDAAAGLLVAKKTADLDALVRKATRAAATAYILVEDRHGKVAAQSLTTLPSEVQPVLDREPPRQTERRIFTVAGRRVYEVLVPLLDGRAGAVRVGLWGDDVDNEIRRLVAPVLFWILTAVASGLICSVYFVWRINRPIVRLVRVASEISRGDLDTPLSGTHDPGEFGELSRALERMRCSIKAAMTRLG